MKKNWWILPVALLAVFGLLFVGCDGGSGGDDDDDDSGIVREIVLADNFQYGDGYQGKFSDFYDGKFTAGERYELKMTFTASRDLEDALWTGLVSCSSGAGYWDALSWDSTNDDGTLIVPSEDKDETYKIKKGEVVSVTLNFTVLKTAFSAEAEDNQIMFQTAGDGDGYDKVNDTQGTAGSGVEGPVTLSCTEFTFTKK
jgi:hypothetical protein